MKVKFYEKQIVGDTLIIKKTFQKNEEYGVLQPLIEDKEVKHIVCGYNFVDIFHENYGFLKTNLKFKFKKDFEELKEFELKKDHIFLSNEKNLIFVKNLKENTIEIRKRKNINFDPKFACLFYKIPPKLFVYLRLMFETGKNILVKGNEIESKKFIEKVFNNSNKKIISLEKYPELNLNNKIWAPLCFSKEEIIKNLDFDTLITEKLKDDIFELFENQIIGIGKKLEENFDLVIDLENRRINVYEILLNKNKIIWDGDNLNESEIIKNEKLFNEELKKEIYELKSHYKI